MPAECDEESEGSDFSEYDSEDGEEESEWEEVENLQFTGSGLHSGIGQLNRQIIPGMWRRLLWPILSPTQ